MAAGAGRILAGMAWRLNPTVGLWVAGVAALATLLGLVAVMDPLLALLAVVAIVFVAMSMIDLTAGVIAFTLLVGAIEVIPGLGDVSAAKLAAGVLVLAWAGSMVTHATPRRQMMERATGLTAVAAVLVLWASISTLWAEDAGRAESDTIRLALNMLLVPIVFAAINSDRDLRRLAVAFIAGTIFSGAYGYLVAPQDVSDAGRLGGAGIDPNYLGVWLVAGAALSAALTADRDLAPAGRFAALVGAVVCIGLLLLTASRTGLVALGVVAIGGILSAGPGRRLPLILVVVVAAAGCVLYYNAVATQDTREHVLQADDGSGRTSIWAVGWRMVRAEPVRGVGMGNFQVTAVHHLLEPGAIKRDEFIVTKPKQAHNVYLEVLAELGAVGLTLFLAVVLICVGSAMRAARIFRRLGARSSEVLSQGTLLAMLAVLTGCFFVSIQYTKPIWMLLALGPVLLSRARMGGHPEHGAP
jgi:O-antigen ligase